MTPTACPLCGGPRRICFRAMILNKYDAAYLFCPACGLVQPETPYWLEEAYSSAITKTDIGLVQRNIENARKLACLLFFCFERSGCYLDLGGGYGLLTRQMRDIGFDYYWSDEYCENIFAHGLEAGAAGKPFNALSAFEVMEHVLDPLTFARTHLETNSASTLIFSQELYQEQNGEPPRPEEWWYYSPENGQHVSLFQARTLDRLAANLGLSRYSYKTMHILTANPLQARLLPIVLGPSSHFLLHYVKSCMTSRLVEDVHRAVGLWPPSNSM